MMTITLMALARRLQNRTISVSVSTEVSVWQVQTNKVRQIHIHRFFWRKCPINWYNTLDRLPFTLSHEDSKEARVWQMECENRLVKRFLGVRIDASCVTPHFASFFFFLCWVEFYQPGVRKLWSAGQIWPTGCFCTVMNSEWFLHL